MAAAADQPTLDALAAGFVGVLLGAAAAGTITIHPQPPHGHPQHPHGHPQQHPHGHPQHPHGHPQQHPHGHPQHPHGHPQQHPHGHPQHPHVHQEPPHVHPQPPPVPPANNVREHDDEMTAHGRLRDFTVAINDVETAKDRTIESRRNMFIYADELLKRHTIPIVSTFNVAYVQRLWRECGWRGHVIYPTEPADFLPQGRTPSTLEDITDMVRRSNVFPLSAVDLGYYDRQELIATHQTLTSYGYWCAEVNRHLHAETISETQYRDAGLRLFSQACLPVVNEADVLSVRRLRVEFGCIVRPLYPRDCADYTNVEQHQHVRERAEFHGFWIR